MSTVFLAWWLARGKSAKQNASSQWVYYRLALCFQVGTKSCQHQVSGPWSRKESGMKEKAAEEWVDASPSAKEGYLSIFLSQGNVSLQCYFNLQRMRKACSVAAEINTAIRRPPLRDRDHMCFARGVCFALREHANGFSRKVTRDLCQAEITVD